MQTINKDALKYIVVVATVGVGFMLFAFNDVYSAKKAIENYTEFYKKRKTNIDTIFHMLDTLKNNECFFSISLSPKNSSFFYSEINGDSCKLLYNKFSTIIDEAALRIQLKRIGLNYLSMKRNRNTVFFDGRNPSIKHYRLDIWNDTVELADVYYNFKRIGKSNDLDDYRTAWVHQIDSNVYLVSDGAY